MGDKVWKYSVGKGANRVTVFEMATRKGVLYLRWKLNGKPKHESLEKGIRTKEGRIVEATARWARSEAQKKNEELIAGIGKEPEKIPDAPLTIKEGLARAIDPKVGKYPTDTLHRREVIRSFNFAMRLWGDNRAWNTIKRSDLRALVRARLDALLAEGKTGFRTAETTMSHITAVANWLRSEEAEDGTPLIDEDSCVPEQHWRQKLGDYWNEKNPEKGQPEANRPRYTLEEIRRIFDKAGEVDPRFKLLTRLGIGLRLGQVRKCSRRNLSVNEDYSRGTLYVPSRGKKKTPLVDLSRTQLAALKEAMDGGYLQQLESAYRELEITSYPLFPQGQLPGSRPDQFSGKGDEGRTSKGPSTPQATVEAHANLSPIVPTTIGEWWNDAEKLAGIVHVKGRRTYGGKRSAVDFAKKNHASREGLKNLGGWTDTQTPDNVYAEQDTEDARAEARDLREQFLTGELG